jgi:hypothetical protein
MKVFICTVLLSLISACAVPATKQEQSGVASAPIIVCEIDTDCPWEWKECRQAVCSNYECIVETRHAGEPCTSGVGVCLADGSCKPPVGACKPDERPFACTTSADCIDPSECTWGECVNKECHYTQDSNGGPCLYSGMACNWGACCAMPAGVCEEPKGTAGCCSDSSQCDDADSCTWDSCEQGSCQHAPHPDGTYCTMTSTGDGQCLSGACCLP